MELPSSLLQAAAAAKIMEEAKAKAQQEADYEEANRLWNEHRNKKFPKSKMLPNKQNFAPGAKKNPCLLCIASRQ